MAAPQATTDWAGRTMRALIAGSMAGAIALLAASPASAASRSQTIRRIGPFTIDKVWEGNRFDRCAATLKGAAGELRIAQNTNQVFAVSVPGVAKTDPFLMTLDLGPQGMMTFDANGNKIRAWARIDTEALAAILELRNVIKVEVGNKRFSWNIGNTSMNDVMIAVESCVEASVNG